MDIRVVKGEGPQRPKLILIGEAPGEEEENQLRPFVGPSGQTQDGILSSAGLLRKDCFIDNVIPIRPPMNKMQRLPELGVTVDTFIPNLTQTLQSLDCQMIVAYGDTAMHYLTGMGEWDKKTQSWIGVSKHRGSIYPCILDPSKQVVPTFHPRFVNENWKYRGVVVEDVKKAVRIGKGGKKDVTFNTLIRPTMQEVEWYLIQCKAADKISFDIETVGSGQIACVGIGRETPECGGRNSLCIPFKFGYNNYWSESDEYTIWGWIRDLFQGDQLKIGQNISYDFTKLLPFIGEPSPPWYDLMVAFHLLEPELPHSLAFMTSIFTDVNYYKDDPKDEDKSWKYTTSSENLWEYNGKDVEIPLTLEPILTKELKEMGMLQRFYGFDMSKMRVMWRIQQRGLLVDEGKRIELLVKAIEEVNQSKQRLNQLVGYDLNPLSSKQMIKFLYQDLKLPVYHDRKTKKATADKETLNKLIARYPRPEFHLALNIRDKIKDIGTYLATKDSDGDYSLPKNDPDGRCRSKYNVCGTDTGRSSASKTYNKTGLDLQNIPEELRDMFIASDGKVMMGWDLWQAEIFVAAVLSNCQALLNKLRKGEKVHRMVAGWIFNKPESEVDSNNKPGGEYYVGKRVTHAKTNGLQPMMLAVMTKKSIKEAEELLARYDRFAPEMEVWHQQIVEELQRTKILVDPFGKKRLFRSFRGPKDKDTAKKAFAHLPQSTIAQYAHQAIIKLEYLLPPGNEIVQEGFDSFLVEAREEDQEENRRLAQIASNKILIWKGEEFRIPLEEAGSGKRWKK